MGARFSAHVQTSPGAHPASCKMGTGSFPGIKSSRGMTLTPDPLLVPWSRKSRAIPLLLLWAWPVQSLSACTRVYFTFTVYISNEFLYTVVVFCILLMRYEHLLCCLQNQPPHYCTIQHRYCSVWDTATFSSHN